MYVNMYASFLRMINLDKHFFEAALCMYVHMYIHILFTFGSYFAYNAYVTIGSRTYIFLGTPFFV